MRRVLSLLLVLHVACSDDEPGRSYGDAVSRPGDSATGGDAMTGDPLAGDPLAGDPLAGDPLAGDPLAGDPLAGDPLAGDPLAGDPLAGDPLAGDPLAGDPLAGDPGLPPAADIIITEFGAIGSELVEITNRGSAPVDIQGWTLNGSAIDHPITSGNPVVVNPGVWSWGAPDNSGGPDFIYGAVTLDDSGDILVLADQYGRSIDTVDFTNFHTDPDTSVGANAFPGVDGATTQLDRDSVDGDNDDGALWCVTFRYAATEGETNLPCNDFVINEVLYDFDAPGISADGERVFVELAGPGGGSLAGLRIQGIEGTGGSAGSNQQPTYIFPAGYRMPVDGLFVLADGDADDGNTFVPGADVVRGACDPENSGSLNGTGGDAIQLEDGAGNVIDILGYGAGFDGAYYENTPVADIAPADMAISIARNGTSTDTDDNSADFHFDPTPTPGAVNDSVTAAIVGMLVDDGLAAVPPAYAVFTTRDFAPVATIDGVATDVDVQASFAGIPATGGCIVFELADEGRGEATLLCPPDTNPAPLRGDMVLTNPPVIGGQVTITDGWTYTGVNNETDTAAEVDFCNLHSPATLTAVAGSIAGDVWGRVYEAGVTEAAGDSGVVLAEAGFGTLGTDPTQDGSWGWFSGVYNVQVGNDDEYVVQLPIPAAAVAGDYSFTYRISLDDGLTFTYCDLDGAGSNGGLDFSAAQLGVLTVQ